MLGALATNPPPLPLSPPTIHPPSVGAVLLGLRPACCRSAACLSTVRRCCCDPQARLLQCGCGCAGGILLRWRRPAASCCGGGVLSLPLPPLRPLHRGSIRATTGPGPAGIRAAVPRHSDGARRWFCPSCCCQLPTSPLPPLSPPLLSWSSSPSPSSSLSPSSSSSSSPSSSVY